MAGRRYNRPRAESLRRAVAMAMAAQGITQAELAQRVARSTAGVSVTQPSISAYLAGRKDLRGESLDAILSALRIRITWPVQ